MMYFNKNSIVFLNGNWISAEEAQVSLYSQTMHYGNGVFEGIRAYHTQYGPRAYKVKEHYNRLIKSAEKMYIPFEYTADELASITYELLERNGATDAYIRPLIFLDPNMTLQPVDASNLFICTWKWGRYYGDQLQKVMTSSYQRPNPNSFHVDTKTVGHYTNSILATSEAKHNGYDEGLLVDMYNNVSQGAASNFFLEKKGTLYTCPQGSMFPGITRKTIMKLAKQLHVEVDERYFTVDEVKSGDSAFFTGTATEVAGIQSLDDYTFPLAWEDSIGFQLSKMYQLEVRQTSTYESTVM